MLIVFRTDASILIGTGHVIRCLTLADEFSRQGHECRFVCRGHKGHLGDLIIGRGYELTLLPAPAEYERHLESDSSDNYASWLGLSWQDDARQTLRIMDPLKADWLVVDHYALDAEWEKKLAHAVGNIMVIDDLANRTHECAMLLDQNVLEKDVEQRYSNLVNAECCLLMGPKYALLRPEYADLSVCLPGRDGIISRVLIFVGGSDRYHLTELYLKTLLEPKYEYLFVDVVIGANHPSQMAVKSLVDTRPNTRLYKSLPSLAALMIRADLMLGAGGSTTWERMCLGLNSIAASVAENQDQLNQELFNRGLISYLGKADQVDPILIESVLGEITASPKQMRFISREMRTLVDGQGCQRVAHALMSPATL